MNFIKKLFINLTILLITFLVVFALLILASREGYLDQRIKKIFEFYFSIKGIEVIIDHLQVRNNELSISKISVDLTDNARGEVTNLKINFNIDGAITNPLISGIINIEKFALISKNNQQIVESAISSNYTINLLKNKIKTNVNLAEIKTTIFATNNTVDLPIGTAYGLYKAKIFTNTKKRIDGTFTFAKQAHLSFNSIISKNNIQIHGNIANIPIMIYQIAETIIPNHEVILFLQQYIKSGNIQDGTFNLNLDKDVLQTNILPEKSIKAKLHITNLEYKYDKDFPALKKIDTNIIISGPLVKFLLNQAYSSDSLISNGIINFQWKGMANSNFIVNATANGPVVDLIDFIPNGTYEEIKVRGLDLKKSTGQANSKIEMIIPINPHIKNSYNVSTVLSGVELKAFNDNLVLKNSQITGIFNEDKINFTGTGRINNYASNFTYQYNLTKNNNDYESLLKVTANIISANQKISILKIISGNSVLNFEYKKQKDGQEIITANSDLTNLEFDLDRISIYKKLHKSANLTISSKLNKNAKCDVNFNLLGDDNLKIVGKISIKDNKYNISLPIINYNKTNIAGKIILDKDNLNVEMQGDRLDLSNANMIQFLEKEVEKQNIHLKINIDKIELKHGICLDKFKLHMNCDKIKCFAGSLKATIDNQALNVLLITQDNLEQWIVNCDNAGALLKAIGMYHNMKAGTINLTLDVKRREVSKGEIIPILDGTFNIKHFVTTDISLITRMISFVSLPGFINVIINNKAILFDNMTGKFNYIGKTVTILDTSASGPFFDFTMKGAVDTNKHEVKLKGNVIPSFFLISKIIIHIPIVGKIFAKVVPYSIILKYQE